MSASLSGKSVVVVGMARSGLSAADFLNKRGARVKVSESRPRKAMESEIRFLEGQEIDYEVGGHLEETFLNADLIVVSPGVPLEIPPLQQAIQAGKEIISELELAWRFLKGKVIAITGTNGKTTTTTLIGEILKANGSNVQVGGNIGVALTSLIETSSSDTWNVVEASSFQLEASPTFRPNIAIVLNITPDHLDRYNSFNDYVRAKLGIFGNQSEEDFAVLNYEDSVLRQASATIRSKVFWFSNRTEVPRGTYFDGNQLILKDADRKEVILLQESVPLRGRHNIENIAAAVTAANLAQVVSSRISEAVRNFKAVEHRLEYLGSIQGVQFYNDSKATNIDATIKALEAFEGGVMLILGGRDKGGDFRVLGPLIKQKVKGVVLLGEAAGKIRAQLADSGPTVEAGSMEEAVRTAFEQADIGDTVLLAPACASFDMFQNYEHRGKAFKEVVMKLQQGSKV